MKVLDVGSGELQFKGDVNVDLYRHSSIPNFVQADGCLLPFRDNAFDMVTSVNVIEHVRHPFVFFRELVRVSREWIVVAFPHRLGDSRSNWDVKKYASPHVNSFNSKWFKHAASALGLIYFEELIGYRHAPFLENTINQYLGFLVRLPAQITVTFRKPQI